MAQAPIIEDGYLIGVLIAFGAFAISLFGVSVMGYLHERRALAHRHARPAIASARGARPHYLG